MPRNMSTTAFATIDFPCCHRHPSQTVTGSMRTPVCQEGTSSRPSLTRKLIALLKRRSRQEYLPTYRSINSALHKWTLQTTLCLGGRGDGRRAPTIPWRRVLLSSQTTRWQKEDVQTRYAHITRVRTASSDFCHVSAAMRRNISTIVMRDISSCSSSPSPASRGSTEETIILGSYSGNDDSPAVPLFAPFIP